METSAAIAATTTATTVNNKTIRSLYLAKYIKNIQQANKKTAIEHRYRLSRFERYIATVFEQIQQQQQQNQGLETIRAAAPLDQLIDELNKGSSISTKNDPYDLFYMPEEKTFEFSFLRARTPSLFNI